MKGRILSRIARFSRRQAVVGTLLLTAALELTTIFFRFGLGMESTRDTSFLAGFTMGLRIHHGYWGLLLWAVGWLAVHRGGWRNLLIMIGAALVLSDLIHHFLILWPITGSAEFDLWYPRDQ